MILPDEALQRFDELYRQALDCGLPEPTAMTLATADASGRPSARTVLLKAHDARGFVFYTNTHSRKSAQLAANPRAALCFFWQPLMVQVHVEGNTVPVTAAEADAYWLTRPRGRQIGGWASQQSERLDRRATLEARYHAYESEYAGRDVPRPPHWSGYRLEPSRIEFWTSGDDRLHDRLCFIHENGDWTRTLLNP